MKTVAYTDSMTKVKNKHAYVEWESEFDALIDEVKVEPFSIMVCDVNGLKHVNDTLGHKAGDALVCEASELICQTFKRSPVFRVGGDEFVVVLTGENYEARERLTAQLNAQVEDNLRNGKVVISVGISDFDQSIDHAAHAVFERADALMYTRKRQLKSMGAITRD